MDKRFYTIQFDNDTHLADYVSSMRKHKLKCLVDKKRGGIIGYVLPGFSMEEFLSEEI